MGTMFSLFVDPGTTDLGAAVFRSDTKRLFAARRFAGTGFQDDLLRVVELGRQVSDWAAQFGRFTFIGLEWPQVYFNRFDPNLLMPLAAQDGAILASMWDAMTPDCLVRIVRPSGWKGQARKRDTLRVSADTLHDEEKMAAQEFGDAYADLTDVEADTARPNRDLTHPAHNTMDAVAMGLFMLGRVPKYARPPGTTKRAKRTKVVKL